MVKKAEIPLLFLMAFTLIYSTIGDPENQVWSGLYFIANYVTLYFLFKAHSSKRVRRIGISLSISILIFIVLKFFLNLEIERHYTLVPFAICLIGLYYLENAPNNRKDL